MAVIQMGQSVGDDTTDEEVKEGEETPDVSSTSEEPSEETPVVEEEVSETPVEEVADSSKEEPSEEQVITALQSEEARIRAQIAELRAERRGLREAPKEAPLFVAPATELTDVNPQDVELIEKVLRAKGYVHKDELNALSYTDKVNNHKEVWLQKHPEYLPENDPDDTNWNALKSTIDGYFKQPSNPADITTMLDIAHSIVKPVSTIPIKNRATADSAKEKIVSSSKGGSAGGAGQQTQKSSTSVSREHFHGMSEEDYKELGI